MRIDAHAHIFPRICGKTGAGQITGLDHGRVSVGGEVSQVLPPLNEQVLHTAKMLLTAMDDAGVDKAVLLQGPFYGGCNDFVVEAVMQHPDRLAGAAFLDPWSQGFEERAEALLHCKVLHAVKLECSVATGLFGIHQGASLLDACACRLFEIMERQRLTLTLDLGVPGSASYQTEAVTILRERFPALKIVICHLGQPGPFLQKYGLMEEWRRQMHLAKYADIYFDTSSLPAYFPEPYPYETAKRYFAAALDIVGADKLLWGTDMPSLLRYAPYGPLMALGEFYTMALSSGEREKILAENALAVYF